MIQLPFNRWTLRFNSQKYEEQYQQSQSDYRLVSFRLLTCCLILITLTCLIIYIAQQQSLKLISMISCCIVSLLLSLMLSYRYQKFIRLGFSIYYISCLGTGVLVATTLSADVIPIFLHGFNISIFAVFIFRHLDNRIKIFIIISTLTVFLVIFQQIFNPSNLQDLCFSVSAAILVRVYDYNSEYNSRLAFSFNLINLRLREIIYLFVNEPIFAVSLNERTRQFELEFQNRKLEEQFNIHHTDDIKEFLRNSFLSTQKGKVFKSTDTQLRKGLKRITLEEYLFSNINLQEVEIQETQNLIIEVTSKNQDVVQLTKILVKKLCYGKPILVLSIYQDQAPLIVDKYEEKLKFLKNAITLQSQQIAIAQKELLAEITALQNQNVGIVKNLQSSSLEYITCLNHSIINQLKNYIIYFQQDKLLTLSSDIQFFQIKDFICALSPFFSCLSERQNKQQVILRQNIKFLVQILINVFEDILKVSLISTTISLVISNEYNLNPLNGNENHQVETKRRLSHSSVIQQLIKFSFTFSSQDKVIEENLEFDKKVLNFHLKSNIKLPVINILLSIIGPYDHYQSKYEASFDIIEKSYLNTVSFYIYMDQLQIDPPYSKYVRQKYYFGTK